MKRHNKLQFSHLKYGICSIQPVMSHSKVQEFLLNSLSTNSALQNKNASIKTDNLIYLIHIFVNEVQSNEFFTYEIFSSKYGLLGIIGLQKLVDSNAKIFLYIDIDQPNDDFQKNTLGIIIDEAFSVNFCQRIMADPSTTFSIPARILETCGFIRIDGYYQITSTNRKLFLLSDIIKTEAKNMLSNRENLAQEVGGRVSNLWYSYFSKGQVNLSGGGVEKSIISIKDLINSPSLEGFNIYQHEEAPVISQERIRRFLLEENVYRDASLEDRFGATFSLGAHEAFMRISRCIFQSNKNMGMFFAMSCYGLFPTALSAMKPTKYDIVLLDVDRSRGEKISISHFMQMIKMNPYARSLCLELKTMCGAVYKDDEIAQIVSLCKENNIFLIADFTHNNMELYAGLAYPDVLDICQRFNFHDVALIFTASKTYGLERARVGFILLDEKCSQVSIKELESDMVSVLGTVNDVSKHVAHQLMEIPLEERKSFVRNLQLCHRFNMNLMIAYIEGIENGQLDSDLKSEISREIPLQYQGGIEGIRVVHKPEAGIHMKIDVSDLQHFYYANIRLFNSEIFCYVLNKIMSVVSLHAYCLADPKGYGVRLTFSRKNEVHQGMRLIHDFTRLLRKEPFENPFLPGILAEELIHNSASIAETVEI